MHGTRPPFWFPPVAALVPLLIYFLQGGPSADVILRRSTAPSDSTQYVGSEVCATCHEEIHAQFLKTPHAVTLSKPGYRFNERGCEACHGPGAAHVEAGGDPTKIISFSSMASKERTDVCLTCHAKQEERINFKRSEHNFSQVSCDGCHSSHSPKFAEGLLKDRAPELCYTCHGEIRSSFALPFHHKVPEGTISCIDCHNQHGGFTTQKRMVGTDLACLKCHSDKQGPFVFEHIAVRVEGCMFCHSPHGSNNPRLLSRSQVHLLCLECHSGAGRLPSGEQTPSFHNIALPRYQNCITCHVQIHGSNLNELFFE
jgi:DmsE family decaheme c-type cytochrome